MAFNKADSEMFSSSERIQQLNEIDRVYPLQIYSIITYLPDAGRYKVTEIRWSGCEGSYESVSGYNRRYHRY